MRIFISAGEPSGDLHAANLVRSLRRRLPDAEFVGFGGPQLARSGAKVLYPLVELAVMWFGRVLLNLHKFFALAAQADRFFRDEKPDAVVLIDYPGFHWAIARGRRTGASRSSTTSRRRSGPGPAGGSRRSASTSTTSCAACRSSRPGITTRGVSGAVHRRPPVLRRTGRAAPRRDIPRPPVEHGRARWWRSCPARGRRRSRGTCPVMLRAAAEVARKRPDARFAVACLHDRHRELALEIVEGVGPGPADPRSPRRQDGRIDPPGRGVPGRSRGRSGWN